MITAECVTYYTWCERSLRHNISYAGFYLPRSPKLIGNNRYKRA